MTQERRQYPRLSQPLEGTWRGASGATQCRVGDISLGGCFVYSRSQPAIGEETAVSVTIGESLAVNLMGRVISLDPGMGFGVQFKTLSNDDVGRLGEILERLGARV